MRCCYPHIGVQNSGLKIILPLFSKQSLVGSDTRIFVAPLAIAANQQSRKYDFCTGEHTCVYGAFTEEDPVDKAKAIKKS